MRFTVQNYYYVDLPEETICRLSKVRPRPNRMPVAAPVLIIVSGIERIFL